MSDAEGRYQTELKIQQEHIDAEKKRVEDQLEINKREIQKSETEAVKRQELAAAEARAKQDADLERKHNEKILALKEEGRRMEAAAKQAADQQMAKVDADQRLLDQIKQDDQRKMDMLAQEIRNRETLDLISLQREEQRRAEEMREQQRRELQERMEREQRERESR